MKALLHVMFVLGSLLMVVEPSFAIDAPSFVNSASESDVDAAGSRIYSAVSVFLGSLAVIMLAVAGGFFMVGNAETGKKIAIGAVIGLGLPALGGLVFSFF
jgi:hypothetical protein